MELLKTPERPNPRPVTAQDLSSMRVLNAIVHESLRLMGPSLLGSRLLTEDVEVCDFPSAPFAEVSVQAPASGVALQW